jgi:hypothetical protein
MGENIKIVPKQIGWDGFDWNDLAQDRSNWWTVVGAVMNIRVS